MKSKTRHCTRNEFAIEGRRDKNCNLPIAKPVRRHQQRAMPERENNRAGNLNTHRNALARGVERIDIAITKRRAQDANAERGDPRENGEQKPLLAREYVHEDECSRSGYVCR